MKIDECKAFAIKVLSAIAEYDMEKLTGLFCAIEEGSDIAACFPTPVGFEYKKNVSLGELISHVGNTNLDKFWFDFEMPFEGDEFRPMMIRTEMNFTNGALVATFIGVVPT
tara:strand:+ start:167 stop:499 length:333 start_codon:yes stop_codon:yes gene_type:complete